MTAPRNPTLKISSRQCPPQSHEASLWAVGWHRPGDDLLHASVGGLRVRDPLGKLARFSNARVRVFCWLRAHPGREPTLYVARARAARDDEPNDHALRVTGVLLRLNVPDRQVKIEICPQQGQPFTVTLSLTRQAAQMVSSDQYAVHATGSVLAGQALAENLKAVNAPVPEKSREWRRGRRARNMQKKLERRRQMEQQTQHVPDLVSA